MAPVPANVEAIMVQRLPPPAILLLVILAFGLAACTTEPPPRPTFPEIRFTEKPPLALDVKEIRIEDRYVPPLQPPHVEHRSPLPPADVAQRWAEDRLKAVGRFGVALVVIEEASVVAKPLPVDTGFRGLFKREQAEELSGRLKMRVEVPGDGGMRGGFAEAEATARRTVPEEVSLNRRDEIYYELTQDLARQLDGVMEAAIRQHLNLLVRSP